jgi:hypothetical protein
MGKPEDQIIREKPAGEIVETEDIVESDYEGSIGERVEPTDEQLATLRRVAETIPLRAWRVSLVNHFDW